MISQTLTTRGSDREVWHADGGGRAAVAVMYERHAERVYVHCLRRTGDWAGAEDLTSQVFIHVLRRPERVRFFDGSLVPWLLGLATTFERNDRRGKRRALKREREQAGVVVEPDFAAEADERVDRLVHVRRARDLVRQLPRPEQDVFALCAWSGLSYEEASFALEIPVGTVRSRLSRARSRLERIARESDG